MPVTVDRLRNLDGWEKIAAIPRQHTAVAAEEPRGARLLGVREDAIAAARERRDVDGLEPEEGAIVTYVRQLLRKNQPSTQPAATEA